MKNKKILEIITQKEILLKSKILKYICQLDLLNQINLKSFLLLSNEFLIKETIENKKITLNEQIIKINKQLETITTAKERLEEIIRKENKELRKKNNNKINEEICLLSQF